jgi:hypothetical protein
MNTEYKVSGLVGKGPFRKNAVPEYVWGFDAFDAARNVLAEIDAYARRAHTGIGSVAVIEFVLTDESTGQATKVSKSRYMRGFDLDGAAI